MQILTYQGNFIPAGNSTVTQLMLGHPLVQQRYTKINDVVANCLFCISFMLNYTQTAMYEL